MTDLSLPPLPAGCVLDTNTVLALWMFEDPALPRLRFAVEEGRLRPVASPSTLEELRRVLAYPQFALVPDRQVDLFDAYRSLCRVVAVSPDPGVSLPTCRDADDQKFLELAVAAASPLLISRDKALLRLARHRFVRDCLSVLRPEHVERALV